MINNSLSIWAEILHSLNFNALEQPLLYLIMLVRYLEAEPLPEQEWASMSKDFKKLLNLQAFMVAVKKLWLILVLNRL